MDGEQRQIPSIPRIIQSDYGALLALLFPLVTWGLYAALNIFGYLPARPGHARITAVEGRAFFLYLAVAATAAGLPLLIWRLSQLRGVFAHGLAVEGTVKEVSFYRDRGRIVYDYDYQGRTYSAANAISKNKRTRGLTVGAQVTVVVDPLKPRRALIRELYL